MKWNIID